MLASNWEREDFTSIRMIPGFGEAGVFSLVAGFSFVFISLSIALRISRHHGIIKDPQAQTKNKIFKTLQVIS